MIKLFFLTFFLVSCATKNNVNIPYSSVEVNSDFPGEPHLEISKVDEQREGEDEGETEEVEKKYSIIFGPGVYLTSGLISVIRELEKEGEHILTISGHGLSAYFAAMFAFKYKSDYIEWQYYKFIEEVKDVKLFSKAWNKAYKEILLKDFVGKKFERAPISLILPVFDSTSKKVEWVERGDIYQTLLENIQVFPHLYKKTAAFPWEFFSPFHFRNKGQSEFVAILPLSGRPTFQKPDGFFNGIYTKGISNFNKYQDSFKKVFRLPLENFKIDVPLKSISEDKNLISFASNIILELKESVDVEEETLDE